MTQFLARGLNGTLQLSNKALHPGHNPLIYGEMGVSRFIAPTAYASRFLLVRNYEIYLVYCDHNRQRMRNDYGWLWRSFGSFSWVQALVLVMGLLIIFLSNIRVVNAAMTLDSNFFNAFSLLSGEGTVRTRIHFFILLAGTVVGGYYESNVTSVALATSPPLVYGTLQEILGAGYMIWLHYLQRGFLPNSDYFRRKGIADLVNASLNFTRDPKYESYSLPLKHGVLSTDPELKVAIYNIYNPEALCHHVPEPYQEKKLVWMQFTGYMSAEAYGMAQCVIEHGLHDFWMDLQAQDWEAHVKRTQRANSNRSRSDGPPALSLEFEVMRIFPICGYLFVIATGVFAMECSYRDYRRWKTSGGRSGGRHGSCGWVGTIIIRGCERTRDRARLAINCMRSVTRSVRRYADWTCQDKTIIIAIRMRWTAPH